MDKKVVVGLGVLAVGVLGYLWYRSRTPQVYIPVGPVAAGNPSNVGQQVLGIIAALAPKSSLQTPQAPASVTSAPGMSASGTYAPLAPGWAMMKDPLVQVPGTANPSVPADGTTVPIQNIASPPDVNAGIVYV